MSKGQPPDQDFKEKFERISEGLRKLDETIRHQIKIKAHESEGREFWKAAYLARMPVKQFGIGSMTCYERANGALEAFNEKFKP